MKAVVCTACGPPEVLQLQEVATPTPQPHEVLIEVHASIVTVNDCIVRSGKIHPRFGSPCRCSSASADREKRCRD